jgi:hypothetical protein
VGLVVVDDCKGGWLMNNTTVLSPTKPILREFVDWLEESHTHPSQGRTSEFAARPSPEMLAVPQCAFDYALSSNRPALLATGAGSLKPVIAALILKRSGIEMKQVFQGGFTDDQFEALTETVRAVKNSKLLMEIPVEQTGQGH